jgi:hypothetical protein
LRRAIVDLLGVAGKLEDLFTVRAALGEELVLSPDDGADHAGAHVALLARRDVCAALDHISCHVGVVGVIDVGEKVGRQILTCLTAVLRGETEVLCTSGETGVCVSVAATLTGSARTCSRFPSARIGLLYRLSILMRTLMVKNGRGRLGNLDGRKDGVVEAGRKQCVRKCPTLFYGSGSLARLKALWLWT